MGPRGGVGVGALDLSYGPDSLDLGSCGGLGLGEMALRHGEGGAILAGGDGYEYHLLPYHSESVDEWGVLGGLLLLSSVAAEVYVEPYLDEDEVALHAVESARVR